MQQKDEEDDDDEDLNDSNYDEVNKFSVIWFQLL